MLLESSLVVEDQVGKLLPHGLLLTEINKIIGVNWVESYDFFPNISFLAIGGIEVKKFLW